MTFQNWNVILNPMNTKIDRIIKHLQLEPHPEGGFFKETYRSVGEIGPEYLPDSIQTNRNYATGIYFLLTHDSFSAFHKIHQDEMWHFYDGDAIRLHMISPSGVYSQVLIGRNFEAGEQPQFVVPAETWFASEVAVPDSFALAGCTVAPGFDFADFELPKRETLINKFPEHHAIISRLTRF